MQTLALPAAKVVRDLLHDLLGREVTITQQDRPPAVPPPESAVAVYRDDAGYAAAVVVADLALSAYAGAGLALMGKDIADQAIVGRSLPPLLAENLHEVLNIVGALFNTHRPVRLSTVHLPGEMAPMQVSDQAASFGRPRIDLDVSISGYGTGQMSVVL